MSDRATRSMDTPLTPAEVDAGTGVHAERTTPSTGTPAPESEVPDPAAEEVAERSTDAAAPTPADGEVEVECPGCGLLLVGDRPRPTAEWFCPRCDYPVFWASPPTNEAPRGQARARRRLPGASGREALGSEACWNCGELNDPGVTACLRCAATLPKPVPPEPEQVVVTVEVERPVAVPYVARSVTWPFVAAAALAGSAIAILLTLVAVNVSGTALLGPLGGG